LNASFGTKQGLENQHINANCPMFVPSPTYGGSDANVSDTVTSKWAKGSGGPSGSECGLFVAQPIVLDRAAFNQGENAQYKFRAEPSETMDCLVAKGPHAVLQPTYALQGNMIGRNDKAGPQGDGVNVEVCFTQNTTDRHAVAYNIAPGKGELKDDIHVTDAHVSKTIDASASNPAMHQDGAAIVQPVGVDIFNAAFTGEVSVPLTRRSDGTGTGPTVMTPTVWGADLSQKAEGIGYKPEQAPCLATGTHPGHGAHVHATSMAVRRLTPIECERLQGFCDNYTDIKPKGKPTPDGPRYKALGNSMAVPVMAWIGKRIQEVENIK
jgi:site-specific DNA-cytosine methylase